MVPPGKPDRLVLLVMSLDLVFNLLRICIAGKAVRSPRMTRLSSSALMHCITWGVLESTVRDGVITRSGGTAGPPNIRPHYFCIGLSFWNRSRNGDGEIFSGCASYCKR